MFSSLIDDFYAVKSIMDGFYHRTSSSYFEKFKFYISFLLRYIVENDPDNEKIEVFIDKNNVANFKVFLGNFNIIYEDIISRRANIKSYESALAVCKNLKTSPLTKSMASVSSSVITLAINEA